MKISSSTKTRGVISLAKGDGKFFKLAIFCRTGRWEGMNGFVNVTREMLQALADHYNAERADAVNEFDYAPILKDHERKVDNVLGRIDISTTKLFVQQIPGTKNQFGLYGDIRIDCDIAREKVTKGLYSQLSLTFDDETNEIIELSFVAVEAARRSQVLSKGEKSMAKKIPAKKKTTSLALVNAKNKTVSLALVQGVTSVSKTMNSLQAQVKDISLKLKGAGIKSQLANFVREGKMSKAEMTKINIASLSALDESGVKLVMDSYTSRKPSFDGVQFGQEGAKPAPQTLSSKDFRKLKDVQLGKADKKSLSAEEKDEKDPASLSDDITKNVASLESEDVKDIEGVIAKCLQSIKDIGEQLASLTSSATELSVEVKEEEEVLSQEDDEDDDKSGEE